MSQDLQSHIKKTLADGLVLQLSTVNENQPWAVTLYYASDDKLNIYWLSKLDARHSRELASNPKAAGAIPLDADPSTPNVGIQVQGIAGYVCDPAEVETAIRLYAAKFGNSKEFVENFLAGRDEHKLYKLLPHVVVLLDEKTYPDNPRQEWKLA